GRRRRGGAVRAGFQLAAHRSKTDTIAPTGVLVRRKLFRMSEAIQPQPSLANSHDDAKASSQPLRVLYVDHTASMGGGEIALLNLVRHLDRDRYTPVVVLFSDGPLRQELIDAGAEVHLLSLSPDVVNTRKDSLGGKTLLQLRNVWTTSWFALKLRK